MNIYAAIAGAILLVAILWDSFEAVVLPRRVTRRFRFTRLFYRSTWIPWSWVARRIRAGNARESFLSVYGPMSLLFLLGTWAFGLILSFALLQWSTGSPLNAPDHNSGFWTELYLSGTTFFTLGIGDVTPRTEFARVITVVEAGMGFGFLALVIGYLPVLYQAFSRREVNISLLDARAGSPATAVELLRRHVAAGSVEAICEFLRDWELWSAELLESHLSYPVLAYYRSQHSNQSWLAALTTVLDVSALVIVGVDGTPPQQAQLTFAMARHAVVDLSQVFNRPPRPLLSDRLSPSDLKQMRSILSTAHVLLREGEEADQKLNELRKMYEPYVHALAQLLNLTVPPWFLVKTRSDNWQTSAWERISATAHSAHSSDTDEHF